MTDYAYINARIRAMLGRLFNPAAYEALLAKETPAGLLEGFRESPYAQALERTAEVPDSTLQQEATTRVDEALRWDLAQSLSKLRRIASSRPRRLVEMLLLRWDAYNLKTIVRGKRAMAPTQEILASTFPVGVLDETALAELVKAPSLRALANTLGTWRIPLARPVRDGLRVLEQSDTLQSLEFELDRWTFAEAFHVTKDGDDNDRVVRDYLRLLVEKANLLTALRYLEERSSLSPVEAARYFLEGDGRFTRAQYETVVGARDLRHGLSLLAGTPYGWLREMFAEVKSLSPTFVERRLDRSLLHEVRGFMRRDPLGIGVAVAYIEQKINEVRNLRMIMRGKSMELGNEQIAEWLIV